MAVESPCPLASRLGQPGSYSLEGSNGYLHTGSTRGRRFGHPLSTGDTVGLGVNFKKMEVRFRENAGAVYKENLGAA